MRNLLSFVVISLLSFVAVGQDYTSYLTGNTTDAITNPAGGICLMGGATEHDGAMIWFLQRANGGDILVLRASGSDGYNDYMYTDLGVTVNSVETIVFNNANASNSSYVQDRISRAEAIWMAGGDQWNYVSYWRDSPIDSLINIGLNERNLVIGGTSAGMAVQGGLYFSAQNGTVTSAAALSNPYNADVVVDSAAFLNNTFLEDVITDTHYDDPDRKGRHVVFMARALVDYGMDAKGIACDEYTAVCIDHNGIARVYGDFPSYDDNAYFLQVNCEIAANIPEQCNSGSPLTWNHAGEAVKVYAVKGTNSGTNTFNLNDWQSGNGGSWQNWWVNTGLLNEAPDDQIHCSTVAIEERPSENIEVQFNGASSMVMVRASSNIERIEVFDPQGKLLQSHTPSAISAQLRLNDNSIRLNLLRIQTRESTAVYRMIR